MLLNSVRLYLHTDEFDRGIGNDFLFRSCYVSNFVTRHVRLRKAEAERRHVFVQGRRSDESATLVSVDGHLIVPTAFDGARFESLAPGEQHEFFLEMLLARFVKCSRDHQVPLDVLVEIIEVFRNGGYRNEWTHQRKVLRSLGLRAELRCQLDSDRFGLTLRLEGNGSLVFERQILETQPDELLFAHRFKDVVVEGDAIVVRDKYGDTVFSVRRRSLH